jgi:hypothetical protein
MSQFKSINIQNWSELDKNEYISYYNEIKSNKVDFFFLSILILLLYIYIYILFV